jgi:hypothetical protein
MTDEKNIEKLVRDTIALIEESFQKFEAGEFKTGSYAVCLDCRKIVEREDTATNSEIGHDGHNVLAYGKYIDGYTDVVGALICLEWLLEQIEGGK